MQHRVRLSALILTAALVAGADAPTDVEWAPIAQAMESNAGEAVASIEAITAKYPRWPDGFRALAIARLQSGDPGGAWKAARSALGINKNDVAAATIGIQCLALAARYDDAYKVANLFTDQTDTGGAVASQAAITALQANNDERLATYLASAKARGGANGAPILDFVEAKQAQKAGDLPTAAAALGRAIAARPDYRDALYELGRVRIVQALTSPELAIEQLKKAEEAFQAAARLDSRDHDSRFGLGRARLELGKRMIAANQAEEGNAMLRMALTALDEGLQLKPTDRDAKLWKGDTLLRLERYEEAAPLLRYALANGAPDRALPFNLSLALSKSGKAEEAAEVLNGVQAESTDEVLTMAMSAYEQGNWVAARKLLMSAIDDLPIDTPANAARRWSTLRFVGHTYREQAAALGKGTVEYEEMVANAVNCYETAGDNADFASRHWYMYLQVPRGPKEAFLAGRKSVAWDGWWNPTAWKLLAGNYGYKVTRGEGVGGAFKHGPAHVMLWLLLAIIPIGLFLKGWLLPNGLYGKAAPSPSRPPTARTGAKPGTASAKPGAAGARKPGTAGASTVRKPGPPGAKPPSRALAPKDGTGPKTPFSG